MGIARFIARQLGRPSGLAARPVAYFLNRANARINRRAVQLLAAEPDHHVLDIGFGGGVGLVALAERVDRGLVAGIEVSEPMLERARSRFQAEIDGGRMDLRSGTAEAIPFPDATFDRVVSVHTIYFWPDPQAALVEVRRVLRPGGRLLLATWQKERMQRLPTARHGFRLFSEEELARLLERAGFARIAVQVEKQSVFSSGEGP